MGIISELFDMMTGNCENIEVEYTGREIYHMCGENGEYDAKIEVKPDSGDIHYYESKDAFWDDHLHEVYDKEGNYIGGHPDGENHPWEHRFHD